MGSFSSKWQNLQMMRNCTKHPNPRNVELNDEKIEAMLVGSLQTINLTKAESIQTGGQNSLLNPHVNNLGVFLDRTLSMEQYISQLCFSAYLAMRQIPSIRRYLTEKKIPLSSWSVHLCSQG